MIHKAVLQKEVLEYLTPKPNENFIDCTIDGGGHTAVIIERIKPNGKILGIEIDKELYQKLEKRNRLILVNDSYTNLKKIIEKYNFGPIDGILFDLGMSSWHLEKSSRGFTFLKNEPLDMRYNVTKFKRSLKSCYQLTGSEIVNQWPEPEIEKILKEYGEERFAKRIARKIVEERRVKPIKNTFQLVEVIKKAVPSGYRHGRIHPATRTFQALRIAVNDELNNLKKVLPQTIEVLKKEGRIVIISFHSLEDRIVKNFFRKESSNLQILTKKPIRASQEEIKINPRSRSAKLRAAIKL